MEKDLCLNRNGLINYRNQFGVIFKDVIRVNVIARTFMRRLSGDFLTAFRRKTSSSVSLHNSSPYLCSINFAEIDKEARNVQGFYILTQI